MTKQLTTLKYLETGSLTEAESYYDLHKRLEILARKLNNLLQRISESHGKPGAVDEPPHVYSNLA